MPREAGIERHACRLLDALGWWHPKMGTEGWPDRLVVWAPGRHFWIEFKQPDGSLTAAQRQRIPRMRSSGEVVFVPDSRAEVEALLEVLS